MLLKEKRLQALHHALVRNAFLLLAMQSEQGVDIPTGSLLSPSFALSLLILRSSLVQVWWFGDWAWWLSLSLSLSSWTAMDA